MSGCRQRVLGRHDQVAARDVDIVLWQALTDCEVQATSTGLPSRSIPAVVVRPDGGMVTCLPTRNEPAAIWPA
ncbi:hypothetical protein BC342_18770 [Streptomyces olivaceus]|nr:hypothetical protein BC342_18770 [Streptomyces olivaceus]